MLTHVTPYAGYTQFYLNSDPKHTGSDDPEFWSKEAYRERLALAPFTLAVGTDTYGKVPVDIEILDSPSQLQFDDWDHVVDGSIDIPSGILEVSGCPDSETLARIEVVPGIYVARVFCRGLSEFPDDGGSYNGDSYLIQLWRGEHTKRTVLKRFERITA
jgi:hypothetical protein